VIPVVHAVEAARAVYDTGEFSSALLPLAQEGMIAMIYMLVAWILLSAFEGSARKSANTEVL